MPDQVAHQKSWQIFEVIVGLPYLLAFLVQWGWPLSLPDGLRGALWAGGGLLVVLGLWLIVATRREFARAAQPTDPGQATTRLMTAGVFAWSRNPLYVGGFVFLAGVALALNSLWNLLVLLPALLGCHFLLVLPEERYLLARFGKDYEVYCARVGRWLGRRG